MLAERAGKLESAGAFLKAVVQAARHPVYTNAFFLWLSTGVVVISGFGFWSLATHLYSADSVGRASAALSAMNLLAVATGLGMGMGLIRLVPAAGVDQESMLNTAFLLVGLLGALAGSVFLLGLRLWSPDLLFLVASPERAALFMAFTSISAIANIAPQAFMAFRGARQVLAKVALSQLVRLVLPVPLLFLGAFGLVCAGGASALAVVVVGALLMPTMLATYRPRVRIDRRHVAALLPVGLANHATDLALGAPSLVLPLVILRLNGAVTSAHFYIGYFLGTLMFAVLASLSTSLVAEGSYSEGQFGRIAQGIMAGAALLAACGAGVIAVVGRFILAAFGRGYSTEASTLLYLLCIAAIPASVVYTWIAVLRVRQCVSQMVAAAVFTSSITLLASGVLAARLGLAGAGLGVLIGQIVGALACMVEMVLGGGINGTIGHRQPVV